MECVSVMGKCRACRIKTQKEFQIPIFVRENLQQIFREVTSLEIHENDKFPGILCEECHSRLLDAHKFRQMCSSSAVAFQKILSGECDSDFEEKYKPPELVDVPGEEDFDFPEEKFNPLESLIDTELCQEDNSESEPLKRKKKPARDKKNPQQRKNDADTKKENPDAIDVACKTRKQRNIPIKSRKSPRAKNVTQTQNSVEEKLKDEPKDDGQKKPLSALDVEFVCRICGKKYTKKEGLKSHMRFTHPGEKIQRTVMECNLCGKKYNKLISLRAHMKVVHQGLSLAKCKACGKGFKSNDGLKGHMVRYHGANDMIRCTECTKVFNTKEGLEKHTKEWHDPENPKEKPRNFMCDLCGKAFASPAALLRHTNSHAGIKPYQCTICPRAYQTQHRLKVHLMRHEGIKEHVCTVCGLRKTTGTELRTHMNFHNKDKIFNCGLCPKIFYALANYNLHVRTVHQGIKAYSCPHCDQSFARAGTLKHHVMTHTGEKPHECEECGKRFIQLTALNTHRRTHAAHRKPK